VIAVAQTINMAAMFVVGMSAAYFFIMAVAGLRVVSRAEINLGDQSEILYGHPFHAHAETVPPAHRYHLYFVIPCLNEEAVVANTVAGLRGDSDARIVVVDDGSDDRTGERAREAGGDQAIVIRRDLPDARQGKGAALNVAYDRVERDVRDRGLDPELVILCVMDADGLLSDGAIGEVLPLFDEPDVGGVQLSVRIRNRTQNFLLRFQNHQFWTLSALTQFGRIGIGTVSLGGNGQFTRLTALRQLGRRPWSMSLTEDLDLAISLAVRGWRLTSTPFAAVDQEGVAGLRRLLTQRTRWYQGHMLAARRVPEIWRSPRMTHGGALEMCLYALVPWLFDLPWSILYHLIVIEIALSANSNELINGSGQSIALGVVIWYLLAFWPALVTGFMAKRRDRELSWWRSMALGHGFIVTNYVSYICAWRALGRILLGRNGWSKTTRLDEEAGSDGHVRAGPGNGIAVDPSGSPLGGGRRAEDRP